MNALVLALTSLAGAPQGYNDAVLAPPPVGGGDITPLQYNSWFYTYTEIDVFSYYDSTGFTGAYNGMLNNEQWATVPMGQGVYSLDGTKTHSVLVGQPWVAGYFAVDDSGRTVSNRLLTYFPVYDWGPEKFIVFAYQDSSNVTVTNMQTSSVIWSGMLNADQRQELFDYDTFLKVESDKPVSALSYADQDFYVASRSGTYVGNYFNTWVGYVGNWQNDLSIIAWYDSTFVDVKNTDTNAPIWSGWLNADDIYCIQTVIDQYVTITATNPVSATVMPYQTWCNQGYARFTSMKDREGIGIGTYFTFPVNAGGMSVYVLSYRDGNNVTITDLNTMAVLYNGVLNDGQFTSVVPTCTRINVTSSDYCAVYSVYSGYGADFAALSWFTPLGSEDDYVAPVKPYLTVAPNPVSSRTTLEFAPPLPGSYNIALYNASGRLALDLGRVEAGGSILRLPVDASALPTGTYTALARGRGQTLKAVLLVR